MLKAAILFLRNTYHPLFHLRRFYLFRKIINVLDFPVAIRFPHINHKLTISFSKNASFWMSFGAAGEERERENFVKLVRHGKFSCFYDIGANVGIYGFMFKTLVERGRVFMFEPDQKNAYLIRATIRNNSVRGVELSQCAVSDRQGEVEFYMDDLSSATGTIQDNALTDSFLARHHGVAPKKVTVAAITLDDFCLSHEAPDFMKIDVEGAEARVFAGAASLIERSHPVIFFECDTRDESIQRSLTNAGYILFDFETLQQIDTLHHNNLALHETTHAGLIAAIESDFQKSRSPCLEL